LHLIQQCVADLQQPDSGVHPDEVAAVLRDLAPAPLLACMTCRHPPRAACKELANQGVLREWRCPQAGARYCLNRLPNLDLAREAFRSLAALEPYDEARFGPALNSASTAAAAAAAAPPLWIDVEIVNNGGGGGRKEAEEEAKAVQQQGAPHANHEEEVEVEEEKEEEEKKEAADAVQDDRGLGPDGFPRWAAIVSALGAQPVEVYANAALAVPVSGGISGSAGAAVGDDGGGDAPAAKRARRESQSQLPQPEAPPLRPTELEAAILRLCADYSARPDGRGDPRVADKGKGKGRDRPLGRKAFKDLQRQWLQRPEDPRMSLVLACCTLATGVVTRGSAGQHEVIALMTGRWMKHGGCGVLTLTRDMAAQAIDACLRAGMIQLAPRPGPHFAPRYSVDPAAAAATRSPQESFPRALTAQVEALLSGRSHPDNYGSGSSSDRHGGTATPQLPRGLLHLAQQCVAALQHPDSGASPDEVLAMLKDLGPPPLRAAMLCRPPNSACVQLAKDGVLQVWRCPQAAARYKLARLPGLDLAGQAFRSLAAMEPYDEARFGPATAEGVAAFWTVDSSNNNGGGGGGGGGGPVPRADLSTPAFEVDGGEAAAVLGHKRARPEEDPAQLLDPQPDSSLPGAAPLYGRPWTLPMAPHAMPHAAGAAGSSRQY
ncbi:hypothetical protein Agub_g13974, partial [Astrephomene gubernaculifera]